MRYLIANLVTEFLPKYKLLNYYSEKFTYCGERPTDIFLNVSQKDIDNLLKRMKKGMTADAAESFAVGNAFFKKCIEFGAMLIHSSAITVDGKAYLFSAASGIGKSSHTRLWKQAFDEKVTIINDDKPAVRVVSGKAIVYGTPFDGGSGIAENLTAPLKAIIFLERSGQNSIRRANNDEIIKNLYFSTVHMLNEKAADKMLKIIGELINSAEFYVLSCNNDISSVYVAYDGIANI